MVRAFSVGNSVLKMETVRSPRGALHSSSMMAYSGASSLEAKKLCRPLLTSEPDTLYTVADLTIFSLPKNDAKKKKGRKEDTDTPSREAGNAVNRLEEQSLLAKQGVPPKKTLRKYLPAVSAKPFHISWDIREKGRQGKNPDTIGLLLKKWKENRQDRSPGTGGW